MGKQGKQNKPRPAGDGGSSASDRGGSQGSDTTAGQLQASDAGQHSDRAERRYDALAQAVGGWAWKATSAGLVDEDIPVGRGFTGQRAEDIFGLGWADAIHPKDRDRALAAWAEAVATQAGYENEQRVRRADGVYRTLLVRGVPVRDERGRALEWVGTSVDITERKRAEQLLRIQYAVSQVAAEPHASLEGAVSPILQAMGEALDGEYVALWRVDEQAQLLRWVTSWHPAGTQLDQFDAASQRQALARGVGLPGRVWAAGAPTSIADVAGGDNFPRADAARLADLHSAFAFPVRGAGGILGVIEWFSAHQQEIDPDLLQAVVVLGGQIGVLIERQALEERLSLQASMLERTHDAIFMWELGGRITYWNRGAELLYGYSAAEAIGRVSHELLRTVFPVGSAGEFEALVVREGDWTGELVHTTRDGRTIIVLSRHQMLREPDGHQYVLETARDITERTQLERELAERASELEAIQTVTDVALGHLGLDDLLREVMERLRTVLAVDNVAILLPDASGQELRIFAARGPEEEVAGQVRVPIGQGVAGRIAATRQPLIIEDLSRSQAVNPFLRERLRSLVGVPLVVEDRLIGVLHAATANPHHFTERDVRLLELVGDRLALAIDRARLYQTAQSARHEAEVRANQQAAIVETMADGVVIFDADGRLLQMNTAARELLGHDAQPAAVDLPQREQDSRMSVRDEHGLTLPVPEWPVSRVLRGEVLHGGRAVDLLLHTGDGREVQVSVTGAPVRDAAGQLIGAVCVFRDVTERRQLERRTQQALNALLAMARTAVEPDGAAEVETTEQLPAYQSVRETAQRLAELTCDVLGCRRVGILAIEPGTQLQHPLAVVGLSPEQERQWWADLEEHPTRHGEGADPDLLARFEAGDALVIDMTEPPYDQMPNPYGITTSLYAPMSAGHEMIGILSLDYGGERHRFTEGELALAEAVAQLGALVIERERLLREREEARANELALLTINQRMDEFLSMAAHDLKSPVASGKLNAQVAARRVQRAVAALDTDMAEARTQFAQVEHVLNTVAGSMDRLARLVDQLLDVSRVRTGKLEVRLRPSRLEDIVREGVEEQRQLAPHREIQLELPASGPVVVMADADRIGQVVTNYLTNALRYAPDDHPITITLRVEDRAEEGGEQGERAYVAVRDEGPGIPAEEQERIWARFEQSGTTKHGPKRKETGLGLGLYISREIIERHGGQVGVESEVGKGSTFWFTLPLADRSE